ncbi:MAG: ABC transporter ATP-binding protein, partial [Clostridia bacterium]|nr:ABC transporter ATP-binding protein [Clostridia bacterium]
QRIGVIGATGSGKSTLVNLIPHLYGATSGLVAVNGKDVKEYDNNELRSIIGIVPQKNVLFKGSIRENLLLGGKTATDDELWQVLEAAQAKEIVEKKGGLDFEIEQNGRNLSGGQRQRLCIARALVGNPEILILDDSASALDFKTEAELRHAMANLKQNPTVITVSQRVSSVMNADKIIVLDDGQAVGVGTHDQLLEVCEIYAEICRSQLEKEEM